MPLTLYIDFMSQPSRAVWLFCLLNDIPHKISVVNIAKGGTRQPDFRKVNPNGKVPAIDDDGFLLYESHAILRYLADSRRTPQSLYPRDDLKRRALVDAMMDWHHTNLRPGSAGLAFNKIIAPRMGLPANESAAKNASSTLRRSLKAMNRILEHQPFLVAGTTSVTVADIALVCELVQLEVLRYDLSPYPHVLAWNERVAQGVGAHWHTVNQILYKVLRKINPDSRLLKSVDAAGSAGTAASAAAAKAPSPFKCSLVFDVVKERLPGEGAEFVKKLNCVYRFVVTGPRGADGKSLRRAWTIDLTSGHGQVIEETGDGDGGAKADCTFKMNDDVFISLALGKTSAAMAFMGGKMKVVGNLGKALQFQNLVLQPRQAEIRDVLKSKL